MSGKKKRQHRSTASETTTSPRFPAPAEALVAGGDRFVLRSRLGAGGMCEVFSAVDLRRVECGDSRPVVAVKRLLPEVAHERQARSALAQEYFTLRHLAHPGVVRVFDLHREAWGVCFSMELLEGQPGHAALGSHPAGLGGAGIVLGARIFESLAYLHAHGVSHGDVKPANVFLEQGGRTVLLDFNIARVSERPGAASAKVAHGLPGGARVPGLSRQHASPERLMGAPPEPRGDVFSASCTVYELITGVHPFGMLPAHEAASRGLRPERPSVLTRGQWRELRQGLSFDPHGRPTAQRLGAVLDGHGLFAGLRRIVPYTLRT